MRPTLPGRPKALLLDDDPAVLRLLGRTLAARGLEVLAATEGAGGLDLLLDELLGLDVLVVDLDLPGRDAWAMLRLIRAAGGEEDLGVVVLADRPAPAVRRRLLAVGADAVLDRADGPEDAARAVAVLASSRRARLPLCLGPPRSPTRSGAPAGAPSGTASPSGVRIHEHDREDSPIDQPGVVSPRALRPVTLWTPKRATCQASISAKRPSSSTTTAKASRY